MKATILFFWKMIGVWFCLWDLAEPVRQWMRQELIPGLYLARAAEKASDAATRHRLRDLSQAILARARSPDGLWGTFTPEIRADLECKAQACADLFQRSSSCVEGRNGQLSLKHHALHRFTLRKLQALTVLHNTWCVGTTGPRRQRVFTRGYPRTCSRGCWTAFPYRLALGPTASPLSAAD